MYAHNDTPDPTQTFENTTLVKNWYEDRFQTQVASTTGRTLRTLPTKERVIHQALPATHPGLWETTKAETERKFLTTPPPARINKPSMYTQANLSDRIATYGVADTLTYTLGPNAVTEANTAPPRYMTTTNKELYETRPAQAVAAHPEMFQTSRSTHAITNAMTKSIRGEPSDQDGVAGGKGARGEITRRPGESGNLYGVSVYVDEYAKWGTALRGVPLGETVAKKQTRLY